MTQTVLIVDDEPNIVIPLQFLMEQNGYNVFVAETGEYAVEAIKNQKPDIILLDIMLPGLDGFEICRMIRETPEWQNIKIILVTAMSRDADITKGLSLGADAFIIKPFSNAKVVDKVKELLNKSK